MKKIGLIVVAGLALMACDKIEKPLKDGYGFIDLPQGNKTVLIEEFTGTSCTFCPNGARKIAGYLDAAPNNVVTVALHASSFAIPNGQRPYDFRTTEADDLWKFMGSGGLPGGMFDRAGYPDKVFKNPADWDKLLQERLAIPAEFTITSDFEYDSASNSFSLRANVLALTDINTDAVNLTAYLVEDSIVAPQLDNNVNINDYVHNHVFRSSFAGMTGEQISAGSFTKGQILVKNYTLPANPDWKIKNCSAVVFVYNKITQEVLEAHHASFH